MATNSPVSLLLIVSLIALASTASSSTITPSNFIKSSCSKTQYPALCLQSLSKFSSTNQTSPRKMALAALEESLSRARSAEKFIIQASKSKGMKEVEYAVVKVCIEVMDLCVDGLRDSIAELGKMGDGDNFLWHKSNVMTWVNGAISDADTCMEGYTESGIEGRLKSAIEERITDVEQVTSNALDLVSGLVDGH